MTITKNVKKKIMLLKKAARKGGLSFEVTDNIATIGSDTVIINETFYDLGFGEHIVDPKHVIGSLIQHEEVTKSLDDESEELTMKTKTVQYHESMEDDTMNYTIETVKAMDERNVPELKTICDHIGIRGTAAMTGKEMKKQIMIVMEHDAAMENTIESEKGGTLDVSEWDLSYQLKDDIESGKTKATELKHLAETFGLSTKGCKTKAKLVNLIMENCTFTNMATGIVMQPKTIESKEEETMETKEMKLTVKELKVVAKELGIKGYSKMKREELDKAIFDATHPIEEEAVNNSDTNAEVETAPDMDTLPDDGIFGDVHVPTEDEDFTYEPSEEEKPMTTYHVYLNNYSKKAKKPLNLNYEVNSLDKKVIFGETVKRAKEGKYYDLIVYGYRVFADIKKKDDGQEPVLTFDVKELKKIKDTTVEFHVAKDKSNATTNKSNKKEDKTMSETKSKATPKSKELKHPEKAKKATVQLFTIVKGREMEFRVPVMLIRDDKTCIEAAIVAAVESGKQKPVTIAELVVWRSKENVFKYDYRKDVPVTKGKMNLVTFGINAPKGDDNNKPSNSKEETKMKETVKETVKETIDVDATVVEEVKNETTKLNLKETIRKACVKFGVKGEKAMSAVFAATQEIIEFQANGGDVPMASDVKSFMAGLQRKVRYYKGKGDNAMVDKYRAMEYKFQSICQENAEKGMNKILQFLVKVGLVAIKALASMGKFVVGVIFDIIVAAVDLIISGMNRIELAVREAIAMIVPDKDTTF